MPSLENDKNIGFQYDLMKYFQNAQVTHFTDKSLKLICKKAGFKTLKVNSFIQSCWKKNQMKEFFPTKKKSDALKYSSGLLEDIESRRKA